jgi:DNA-binding HxlR family transcriptional regulator
VLGRCYDNEDCSAAKSLELVGERWSLLILRDAMFRGSTRFSQFQKSLGVATNILAKRLEGFVAAGLMERRPTAGGEQAEYALTQKGLELKPVIIALTQWGDRWLQPGPAVFEDRADGERVEVQLRRVGDDTPVDVGDVVARLRDERPGRARSRAPRARARQPRAR